MSPKETPAARRKRERDRARQDDALFQHLGALHRLEEEDFDLLTAIAAKAGFTRKSDVFVRPSVIERSPDLERWSSARTKRLRTVLEGAPPAPPRDPQGLRR